MKKIIGLVVILFVLVLGSYYGTGIVTENKVRDTVKVINSMNNVYAEVKDYKRGWFHSSAQLEWNLNIPERVTNSTDGQETIPAQEYKFAVPLDIDHGPIIFSDNGVKFGIGYARADLNLPEKYQQQFDSLFTKESKQPQLAFSLFINYLAKSSIHVAVPSFQLTAKEGNGKLDWKGLDSSISINSAFSEIDGDAQLNGFSFTKDGMSVVISKLSTDYNLEKSSYGLFVGSASIDFSSLMMMNKDKTVFALDKLILETSSSISGEVVNSHINVSLDSVTAGDDKYGPAKFEMALRNLDAQSMGRINDLSMKAQHGDDAEKQNAMMTMMAEIPKLMSQGPEFEISQLDITFPQGKVEGNMLVTAPKSAGANVMTVMQQVRGDAHLKMPKALVQMVIVETVKKQIMNNELQQAMAQQNQSSMSVTDVQKEAEVMADKRIAAMVESGAFVINGEMITVDMHFEKGQLTVNGKPFNQGMLKF